MHLIKKLLVGAFAATAFAGSASAADYITITGPSGVYGDDNVLPQTCPAGSPTPCNFTRTFTFATPTAYNTATLDISSILNGEGTDINFTQVLFNGTPFVTVATGIQELRNLFSQSLVAGATNTISVVGTTSGNASFTGNIALANVPAVPEPATWGLMLLGFGAVGFSMRRRRRDALLLQAA